MSDDFEIITPGKITSHAFGAIEYSKRCEYRSLKIDTTGVLLPIAVGSRHCMECPDFKGMSQAGNVKCGYKKE